MKMIADTNVLLRAALDDDPVQSNAAISVMRQAEAVIVSRHAICEFVWVLGRKYRFTKAQILDAIEKLISAPNVLCEAAAFDAGITALRGGADFADGIIAYEGRWLGGETFVSFDKKAVELLTQQGHLAQLLGGE